MLVRDSLYVICTTKAVLSVAVALALGAGVF